MTSNSAFIGLHLSSGRKPLVLTLLDNDLNLIQIANSELNNLSVLLSELESATLCIVINTRRNDLRFADNYSMLHEQLAKMSFRPYPAKQEARQWFKGDADETFRGLLQQKLLPRRTLEGRIQRALILYEQGLQIDDPMELFEEITRFKLMQGRSPFENLYSSKELDALVAAYVAWMTVNKPGQFIVQSEFILPSQE